MDYLPRKVWLKRKSRKAHLARNRLVKLLVLVVCLGGVYLLGYSPWRLQLTAWMQQLPSLVQQKLPWTQQEEDSLGSIRIPSIGLDVKVYEGISESILSKGIGHLESSAAIGQNGNAIFSGYSLTEDQFFNHLDEIQTGDEILLETPEQAQFFYEVTEKKEIPKEEAGMISNDSQGNRITLITTSKTNRDLRLLVEAQRKDNGT
jgi:LPXTG-site transpeptidase (sortase) family protein